MGSVATPIYEPTYRMYGKCCWRGCSAQLHSLEALLVLQACSDTRKRFQRKRSRPRQGLTPQPFQTICAIVAVIRTNAN
jgi:hypothetical protein